MHGTQKTKLLHDGLLEVSIEVVINYELEMKILSFGEKVKVLSPKDFVTKIKDRINQPQKNY